MRVEFFKDPKLFSQKVMAWLLAAEEENNLIIGILNRIKLNLNVYGDIPPLMFAVWDDKKLSRVVMMTPPYSLILSISPYGVHSLDPLINI